jgi:hypothetical protein
MLLSLCFQGGYDACWIYDLNYTSDGVGNTAERGGTVACQNWEYSREVFKENIVTEVSILLKLFSKQLTMTQCINCQSPQTRPRSCTSYWYKHFCPGGKGKLCRPRQGVSEYLKVEFSSSRSKKYKKFRWNLCVSLQLLERLKYFENYFKFSIPWTF